MENRMLAQLLEEDKEQLLENISRDRTPEAAQAAAEKELDRVLYRYSEQADTEALALSARTALRTARNALPLLGTVSEVREWQRTSAVMAKKRRVRPLGLILGGVGLALVLFSMLTLLGGAGAALSLSALLPPVLGAGCLFGGGVLALPGRKNAPAGEPELRREFLVDAGGVYRTLRGILLLADKELQEQRQSLQIAEDRKVLEEGALESGEAELFSGLLEAAYARRGSDADAEEIIGSIRYYLHGKNVDAIDYTKDNERWFELLPARRCATIRPALVSGGRLIRKGLASGGEG